MQPWVHKLVIGCFGNVLHRPKALLKKESKVPCIILVSDMNYVTRKLVRCIVMDLSTRFLEDKNRNECYLYDCIIRQCILFSCISPTNFVVVVVVVVVVYFCLYFRATFQHC